MKLVIFFTFFLLESFSNPRITLAQSFSEANQSKISINKNGMLALGGWSLLNIGTFGVRSAHGSGDKYFNQMNVYWNVANLTIATAGYLSSKKQKNESYSNSEILEELFKTEKILLFNTGLDLAYVGTGLYLNQLGKSNKDSRWKGYGKSLILQGSFLAIFDSILLLKHQSNRKKLGKYKILPASNGIGIKLIW